MTDNISDKEPHSEAILLDSDLDNDDDDINGSQYSEAERVDNAQGGCTDIPAITLKDG